jgi:hypothetical protein
MLQHHSAAYVLQLGPNALALLTLWPNIQLCGNSHHKVSLALRLILLLREGQLIRKGHTDNAAPKTSLFFALTNGALLSALVGLPSALVIQANKTMPKPKANRE